MGGPDHVTTSRSLEVKWTGHFIPTDNRSVVLFIPTVPKEEDAVTDAGEMAGGLQQSFRGPFAEDRGFPVDGRIDDPLF